MEKWKSFVKKMKKKNIDTRENVSFCSLTTLGCGGKIRFTLFPDCAKQLVQCLNICHKLKLPFVVLGAGSNILAGDEFFDGVAIVTKKVNNLTIDGTAVTAECGVFATQIFAELSRWGLSGGEFLSCLPATIGGATVCNAGCFGQSMQQVVQKVIVWKNGKIKALSQQQCDFNKRSSAFKNGRYVVLSVTMGFSPSTSKEVSATAAEFRAAKRKTQPLGAKSAGCVFYHPTQCISALIDKAGLKGFTIGQAKISEKHAGFVINIDKAVSKDIYLIILEIKNILSNNFGVSPLLEICLVNFTKEQYDLLATSKN